MARTRRRVPYGIHQLSKLLGMPSEKMILPLVRSDFVKNIFDEYRQGITIPKTDDKFNVAAPERIPWNLGNVLRLIRLRDNLAKSSTRPGLLTCTWFYEDEQQPLENNHHWTPDFRAARFVWRLDKWVDEINGGWTRDGTDRDKEIIKLAAVLVFMHDSNIGYEYRMRRLGIDPRPSQSC